MMYSEIIYIINGDVYIPHSLVSFVLRTGASSFTTTGCLDLDDSSALSMAVSSRMNSGWLESIVGTQVTTHASKSETSYESFAVFIASWLVFLLK